MRNCLIRSILWRPPMRCGWNLKTSMWATVDTIFWKNRSKGIRRSGRWKIECDRSIKGREGRSTRFADGQRDSTLTVGQLIKAISWWSARRSADEERKGGNQRDTPEGKHGGGGSIHDCQRVKESVFRRSFDSRESPFMFLVFLSLDASKQCCDRLGVGFVLKT
jgi:hypothetical protein